MTGGVKGVQGPRDNGVTIHKRPGWLRSDLPQQIALDMTAEDVAWFDYQWRIAGGRESMLDARAVADTSWITLERIR